MGIRAIVSLIVVLTLLTGCAKQMIVSHPNEHAFNTYLAFNAFSLRLEDELNRNRIDLQTGPAMYSDNDWTPLFSFVHASDVQVRDSGIRYYGRGVSWFGDLAIHGLERINKLDRNDEIPYLALVGAIKANSDVGIRFLLHTGDAIDSGVFGELLTFIGISNQLPIPWYNVIGNHDVFLFGGFTRSHLRIINPGTSISNLLVGSRQIFVALHGSNNLPIDLFESEHHIPTETSKSTSPSDRHGFDLGARDAAVSGSSQGGNYGSYYSVLVNTKPTVRLLVLDTTLPDSEIPGLSRYEFPQAAFDGKIGVDQYNWLKKELVAAEDHFEYVLVAGHHPLTKKKVRRGRFVPFLRADVAGQVQRPLIDILKEHDNVLAYFGGHTHKPYIHEHDANGGILVEVIAPSLHEYPQLALLVTLLTRNGSENGIALSVRPARGRVTEPGTMASKLREACEGARKDKRIRGDKDCWPEDKDPRVSVFSVLQED